DAEQIQLVNLILRLVANRFDVRQTLVISRPVHYAAQPGALFEQHDLVADHRGEPRILHPARAAAGDHDLLRARRRSDSILMVAAKIGILGRPAPSLPKDVTLKQRGARACRFSDLTLASF